MQKIPQVSIVIVNYNTAHLTVSCIMSVKKFCRISHEIIVVDNASTDNSVQLLKKQNVKLIENTTNYGFAKANNQGIKISRGEYILLLNSDTELFEDSISMMISEMSQSKNVIATCKLLNKDASIQATGGFFPTPFRVFAWQTFIDDIPMYSLLCKSFHPSTSFYSKPRDLDWVTGAFFMFHRQLITKVGLFDESFFMYEEEVELCMRAKNKGFQVKYIPSTSIIHFGQASSTSEFAILSEYKNLVKLYQKHFPQFVYFIKYTLLLGASLRVCLFAILGKHKSVKIYAKAIRSI